MMAAKINNLMRQKKVRFMGVWGVLQSYASGQGVVNHVTIYIDDIPAGHDLLEAVNQVKTETDNTVYQVCIRCLPDDNELEEYAQFYSADRLECE